MLIQLSKNSGFILLLWLFSSFLSGISAKPVIVNNTDANPIELGSHYQLFVDAEHKVTIEDILSPKNNIKFSALPDGKFNLGYRSETHWFMLHVKNNESQIIKKLLEFNFPLLDNLSVYIVHNDSKRILSMHDTGDMLPFNSRHYQHPNFILPISLPARTEVILYFRIHSKGSMTAGATLWQPDIFPEQNRLHYFYLALYMGLLIGLLSYNSLLFIAIREISYLYYVLLAGSLLFAVGAYSGLWFERLWPNSPFWHNMSIPISFSLAGIFSTLFSRSFLQTSLSAPLPDKILQLITIGYVLAIAASPIVSIFYIAPILSALTLFLAITVILTALILSIEGDRIALIYLSSWLLFIIGGAVLSARNFGLIPHTLLSQYAIFIGNALAMVLISFALAHRINQVKEESKKLISTNESLRDKEDFLKQLAHYDSLTGLANRTLILEKLDLLLTHSKRKGTKLAVLFLDLDKFKPINDKYGHDVGDDVLVTIANRLCSALRNSDSIGRLGGDEFIVLVDPGDNHFNPQYVANKAKKAISAPFSIMGDNVRLGVSIGIATYPDNGDDIESLMTFADSAMYIDKAYRDNN